MSIGAGMTSGRPRLAVRGSGRMQFRIVPLIDVVFLLLVFFLLTANFRPREGFLPAELPRQITRAVQMEMEPLAVYISSDVHGNCHVQIGAADSLLIENTAGGQGFSAVTERIGLILAQQHRTEEDPVKLVPDQETSWQHVVSIYDSLWRANLRNIIFSIVGPLS